MKNIIQILILFSLVGCASQVVQEQPLKYSFMPKYLDIDSIGVTLPKDPDTLVHADAIDFSPKPTLGGMLIGDGGDTTILPPGILVSERSAVQSIFYESAYRRQGVELTYLKSMGREYYDRSLEAEKLYQDEIIRLRKKAKRSWLEKNLGYLGFIGGLVTAILTETLVVKITD